MPVNFPVPPRFSPDQEKHRRQLGEGIERLFLGRSNNVLDVTLDANSGSTTVSDERIAFSSAVILTPLTANAAAALATTYVDDTTRVNKSVVITHANNAQTDRTFRAVLVG